MLKILLVSNNTGYTNEIKRSAILADVDILANYPSIHDVQRNIDQLNPDIVLSSDILYPGETINELIDIVQSSRRNPPITFVLKDSKFADYLVNKQIPYVFENDIAPTELLNRLVTQYESGQIKMPKLDQRERENFETKNLANILANEQKNKEKVNQYESQMKQPITPGAGFSVVNNFKHICVAINSPKGGVGKTTLAIELATTLASRAKELDLNPASQLNSAKNISVCLVDFNPSFDTMASTLDCIRRVTNYPTLTDWAGKIEEKIFNTLPDEVKKNFVQNANVDFTQYLDERKIRFTKDEVLSLLVKDPDTDLYILPSVALPFDVEYVKPAYIQLILEVLKAMFDIVIIDTGNNVSYYTVESLYAADEIFVVSTASKAASVVIGKLMKNLDRLGLDASKFNLVINNAYGKYADLDASTIASVLNLTLISELPYDENVKKSHESGYAFSIYNKKTPYAREIAKLSQQIAPLWTVTNRRGAGGAAKVKTKINLPFFK